MKPTKFDRPFQDIEKHIQRARVQRALAMAEMIASGITALTRGVEHVAAYVARGFGGRGRPQRLAKRPLPTH